MHESENYAHYLILSGWSNGHGGLYDFGVWPLFNVNKFEMSKVSINSYGANAYRVCSNFNWDCR